LWPVSIGETVESSLSSGFSVYGLFDNYTTLWYGCLMRIFKSKKFAKLAKAAGLSDDALKDAISEVQKSLVDVELGGNLVKKRVAVEEAKVAGLEQYWSIRHHRERYFVSMYSRRTSGTTFQIQNLRS